MAEIREVVEDATKTIKKKFKEKPVFYTALVIVAIFALYKLFSTDEETEETVTNAYVPMGYDGYPSMSDSMLEDYNSMLDGSFEGMLGGGGGTVSGGNTSGGGLFDSILGGGDTVTNTDRYYTDEYEDERYDDLYADYKELYQQMLQMQENQFVFDSSDPSAVYDYEGNLIYSDYTGYKVITDTSSGAGKIQLELETNANKRFYDAVVSEMKANSEAWSYASSVQEKEELNKKNKELAKYIGATYNNATGTWYASNGEKLYGSSGSSGSSGGSGSVVTYDKNVDYASAIKQAKANGASQSVIDQLTAQREAKIKGENLNSDGTKKTSGSSSSSSKSSGSTSSGGSSSSTTVSYDKNKDYAQAIKDAKASGASQSVISSLQAQREAKIKGENLNSDGSKKK